LSGAPPAHEVYLQNVSWMAESWAGGRRDATRFLSFPFLFQESKKSTRLLVQLTAPSVTMRVTETPISSVLRKRRAHAVASKLHLKRCDQVAAILPRKTGGYR